MFCSYGMYVCLCSRATCSSRARDLLFIAIHILCIAKPPFVMFVASTCMALDVFILHLSSYTTFDSHDLSTAFTLYHSTIYNNDNKIWCNTIVCCHHSKNDGRLEKWEKCLTSSFGSCHIPLSNEVICLAPIVGIYWMSATSSYTLLSMLPLLCEWLNHQKMVIPSHFNLKSSS